jgi:hypothetical protein
MIPKKGDRIELLNMHDDPHPIEVGTQGTVEDTQYLPYFKTHQVHVKWDNGRGLSLVMPPDQVKILVKEEE